jgi:hypothetical protein
MPKKPEPPMKTTADPVAAALMRENIARVIDPVAMSLTLGLKRPNPKMLARIHDALEKSDAIRTVIRDALAQKRNLSS